MRQQTALSQEQLDQLLAPIALYPDNLLAQILTASTYPLEVVAAARWLQQNPNVTGQALDQAMMRQPWDASVKGLTAVRQVLVMMSEQLDWTEQLGEAFLAQQDDVTRTVQLLRAKAAAAGTLKESKELKIVRVKAAPTAGGTSDFAEFIQIEPAAPDVINVPVYDPNVVYGAWTYTNHRPFYWRPPGYAYAGALGFGAAVVVGSALWTRYDWRERRVWIDPARYNRFNRTNYPVGTQLGWRYNVQHRGNAPYRNMSVTREYITTRTNFNTSSRTVVVAPPVRSNTTVRGVVPVVTPPIRNMPDRPGIAIGTPGGTHTTVRTGTPVAPRAGLPNPPPNGRPALNCTPPTPRPVGWEPPISCRNGAARRDVVPDRTKPQRPAVAPKPPTTTANRPPAPPTPKPLVTTPRPPVANPPKPPVTTATKPPVVATPKRPVANPPKPPAPAKRALDCKSAGKPPGWRPPAACPR